MAPRSARPAPVPTRVLGSVAIFLGGVLSVHVWFFAADGRTLLTWPVVALVAALVATPLVPYTKRLGVGSVSVVFRRASRDLRSELVRSVERLVPSRLPGFPPATALRNVDSDPGRALSAVLELVYRALYDLLGTLDGADGGLTEGVPEPSAADEPSREDVRSVLDRLAAADPPEFGGLVDVLERYLDSLLTARESDAVTAAEAREIVELGAHLATYVKLYTRLYAETDLGE